MNKAKLAVISASKTLIQHYAEHLQEHWPSDVITYEDAANILSDGTLNTIKAEMRRSLEELGAVRISRQIKIVGYPKRVWVLRNHEKWHDGTENSEMVSEILKARDGRNSLDGAQLVLADAMATAAESKRSQENQ